MEQNSFREWCLVELFGHNRIVGIVSEHQLGGESFIWVDVPETKNSAPFTRMFGKGAIYSLSPISEEIACGLLERIHTPPVNRFELPAPQPEAKAESVQVETAPGSNEFEEFIGDEPGDVSAMMEDVDDMIDRTYHGE